jgi:hypothetical protein
MSQNITQEVPSHTTEKENKLETNTLICLNYANRFVEITAKNIRKRKTAETDDNEVR